MFVLPHIIFKKGVGGLSPGPDHSVSIPGIYKISKENRKIKFSSYRLFQLKNKSVMFSTFCGRK